MSDTSIYSRMKSDLSREAQQQMALRIQSMHPSGEVANLSPSEVSQSIPPRFATMVARYPTKPAIVDTTQTVTYAALDQASNRLARALLDHPEGTSAPIALLMRTGAGLLTTCHGVMRSGGSFANLPFETPTGRLEQILRDMGSRLLVTDHHNLEIAQTLVTRDLQILCLDAVLEWQTGEPILHDISADALFMLSHTSGSSNQPKAVMRTHRDFLQDVRCRIQTLQICAPDRIAGISYGNYSPALISTLAGATYYEFDLRRNGAGAVAEKLAEHEITVLNCKVTTFRQLMRSAAGRLRYPHLRIVRLAGEPPTPGDILSAKGILTDRCVLSNQFGSTESYIATTFAVTTDIAAHLETVPAGFPNEGVEILIVDEAGKTVPTGEEGEIVVQSRHLSPGYWNRPNLTRERFLPDPTGGDRRLYQMGDIGYLDNDGCLHVLGRRDDQVKIRSHKVRISQVEAVLLATAGVDMGAVVARSGPDGSLRLVAYVVAASSKITVSQIRSQMESMLPLAMVPAVFVFVDELPLTVSQKVDRRALPSPPTARPRLSIPYMAPRTRIESTLVQIWGEVLGFDAVGIHDRFLELGGDSLLASQIVSRVVRVLPVQVSHAEIFSAGTVADMSLVITESLMLSTSDVSIEQVIAAAERTP